MTTNQSFWAGPITIVGTGNIVQRRDINIGPDLKEWQQRHDAFLHAPLHLLTETGFSQSGEFYCPDEFENEFYTVLPRPLSVRPLEVLERASAGSRWKLCETSFKLQNLESSCQDYGDYLAG
jgi:hypothetical protein